MTKDNELQWHINRILVRVATYMAENTIVDIDYKSLKEILEKYEKDMNEYYKPNIQIKKECHDYKHKSGK